VIICGYWGAGAAAATEAHDGDASVLVLEKMETGGGSTAVSGGSIVTIREIEGDRAPPEPDRSKRRRLGRAAVVSLCACDGCLPSVCHGGEWGARRELELERIVPLTCRARRIGVLAGLARFESQGSSRPPGRDEMASAPAGSATTQLARFVKRTSFENIPPAVLDATLRQVLDFLGVAAASSQLPWIAVVREYALSTGREGSSAVIGGGHLASEFAALANATAGHGVELDDYHSEALAHPGCVVVPAALAVAQELGSSGQELLAACAVGIETIIRVGLAAGPALVVERGFHETCTEGVFGAAAAAGQLLGLDVKQLESAFGIAASHASGTRQYWHTGGEVKRLHAGLGAAGGLRSALLSAAGFDGPTSVLEGSNGFFRAFASGADLSQLTTGLGRQWRLLDVGFKPYASCALIHPAAEALLAIIAEQGLATDAIESVAVGVDRLSLEHVGSLPLQPTDMNSAQFNLPYSLGMAMVLGDNSFASYLRLFRAGFKEPAVTRAAERVSMAVDAEMDGLFPATLMSRVTVRTVDGREYERTGVARGSKDHPLTFEELRAKFRDLLATTPWQDAAAPIEAALDQLVHGGAVADLVEPLAHEAALQL